MPFAAALAVQAQATSYRVDPARTRIEFSVLHLGVLRADGHFSRATGRIVFDPAARAGSIEFAVAGDSVATGWALRDAFIRGENMFDVEHHPVVRFRSTRLVFDDARLVRVEGELTLRGVTRPLLLAVERVECGAQPPGAGALCAADVDGVIRRRDFGMDFAWPLIGDEVSLRFVIGAVRE
jgi:polyisoprenoid-binding protein YceI